jgi:glutamyl-tRNA synthetase
VNRGGTTAREGLGSFPPAPPPRPMAETPAPGLVRAPDGPVRVRFAPSPTGLLHIGGLRTALYNYLLARKAADDGCGGTFVLRVEDTDQARFVEDAERDILDALRWAGLAYDEGPEAGGPHAPYHQSQRKALYEHAARDLLAAGHAYHAFDTEDEIDAMRARLTTPENPAPKYDAATRMGMRNALTLPPEEVRRRIGAGEPHVVRLKVPEGQTVQFHDLIRGAVSFDTAGLDDQVLIKSDGLPTYHLANVVDDHAMGITHVIRGEEWLPSTPKHQLLYDAFGWAMPQMAHLPLILSPSGGKLSKRNAETMGIPVSVRQYREAGYEPEAVVNFLALLGWHPEDEQELFTLAELVQRFSLERVSRSGAKFDLDKLRWMNGQVLRALPAGDIAARARAAVEARVGPVDPGKLAEGAALLRERLTFAHDLADATYLFRDPDAYDEAGLKKRWKPDSARLARAYADRLEALPAFDGATAEAALRELAEAEGVGAGQLIHPVRLAVTGATAGAGLFETLEAVGREATLRRLRRAADVLG